MISTTNVTGSVSPLSLSVGFQNTRPSIFSPSDLTKLPVKVIQAIQQLSKKEHLPTVNEEGNILCICEQNEQFITGFFLGSLSFFLNETVIQSFNCEGLVRGRIVEDEITLKYTGDIRTGYEVYGKIEVNVWGEYINKEITDGIGSVFLSLEKPEKVIVSPTTRFLPNTSYYPKENLRTTSYLWREAVDKEINSIWDEISSLRGDSVITTARATQIQNVFSRFLNTKELVLTTRELKTLWRATTKFLLIGPIVSGFEQAIKEFTGEAPDVKTVLDKSRTIVGATRIGRSRLSTGLISNTITIRINNTRKIPINKQVLSLFIKNVKPVHLRVILILDTGEALEVK